ncbi:hypothetical protein [Peterkaempfera griseoplana]|uniref:hypothetical protein n=1 Tax=Peterkaempfera griseoplana TaxID=66896 RepID=UPI0006E34DB3|nr:hypothetical protein [Peterkaempfera griseoplana]
MAGVDGARARAHAVLRIRGLAVAAAALPAAVAVVLLAGRTTGRIGAPGSPDAAAWDAARWAVCAVAALCLLVAGAVAVVFARARPLRTPAVTVGEQDAPELYRLIRDLAARMEVPAPSAVALTPDCDSWLEDAEPPRGSPRPGRLPGRRPEPPAPVLVVGSPFLWWMRVCELRALLAPVVAGTAASADPEIAAARRFVRGLDAAGAAVHRGRTASTPAGRWLRRPALAVLDRITRALLGACRGHAAELERAVAGWASQQAQTVDHGLRIAAQEQVGLVYAGWDRLLTRVALPAWRIRRLPAHLNAGVVSALTELSRRDRLAEGFEQRLGDRPACDLLEEPGAVDEATSLLAARVFHGLPGDAASGGRGWRRVGWEEYAGAVVDRIWRTQAAALYAAVDRLRPEGPGRRTLPGRGHDGPTVARVLERLRAGDGDRLAAVLDDWAGEDRAEDDRAGPSGGADARAADGDAEDAAPVVRLAPPRTGRDLLVDHLSAMVCCAAVDTAGAAPGLDWLDGPALLVDGVRRSGLSTVVAGAVEHGDDGPLRDWLEAVGVRLEKPVRLP